MCITGISDCSINKECGFLFTNNGSFTDGLIQTSDSTLTALALGNCDPLTITLVGNGGEGNS